MKREPKNISASVQARLLQRSRDLNVEHQLTLARFGGERLLSVKRMMSINELRSHRMNSIRMQWP